MGGSDDPSNLIELTVEEHAEAHRKLWEEHGRWQDKLAWQGLAGIIGHEEAVYEATRLQWTSPERLEKHRQTCASDEFRKAVSEGSKKISAKKAEVSNAYWDKVGRKPKKVRNSPTGIGKGNHGNHKPNRQKAYLIDGERIVNLTVWAKSKNYPPDSVRVMMAKTGSYKGHTIQVTT